MILVTGAAKGLGKATILALASKGHDVVIHYRTSFSEASDLLKECRQFPIQAEIIQGDFNTLDSLNDFITRYTYHFPHTKGLVNNVGNYLIAPLQKTKPNQWLDLFQTNFFAPLFLTQALLPSLKSIVNIGLSGLEGRKGFTQTTAYATTKAALLSFTLSLAKDLAPQGIRVNMVSPGYMENSLDQPTTLPMNRVATLQEVAQIIATFFDPSTAYITGQNLEIAGAYGL